MIKPIILLTGMLVISQLATVSLAANPIQHDAEHYILLDQHKDQWSAEDKEIDAKLVEIHKKNNGKRPNIIYILVDDVGMGELGSPVLNNVRGYKTPNINNFATQGLAFSRMYAEPSCTPTRAAFLTGRLPVRSHMLEAKIVPPEGTGLNKDEVTIAEVLSMAGYNTVHIGKWHQGDIEQAYPHNQGFDVASFAMHNQATFNFMTPESEDELLAHSVSSESEKLEYVLDKNFRPKGWVLNMDARKGEEAKEWGVKPGEDLTYKYYDDMNQRHQQQAMDQLRRLAKEDKPFFLNYWPMYPLDFNPHRDNRPRTRNGGTWVGSMQEVDGWIGDILDEVETLGIAENTFIIIMGDNGPMKQALGDTGFTDLIYRGHKGETTEGGVRVDAFIRWPAAIQAGSVAGDIVHVSDLYTTIARITGATEHIPRDRIVDGIDQTALLLNGDDHGRRDYVHIYNGPKLAATVKEQFKVHWPAPGTASFKLPVYNLYRDPREERPLNVEGMWTVSYFGSMRDRHMAFKKKYPDREETHARPYEGISNLRPESKALVDAFEKAQSMLN
ncbi:MAG: sulfatase-like hydrolase/transferase [Desulfobacterales bacterium]|nr:sulfatase-like hydrolase/transferase [Desulfobacterales bacterium]